MNRWLSRILISLILGAIINIAVAWILAYCIDVFNGAKEIAFRAEGRRLTDISRWDGFGSTRVYSTHSWTDSADPLWNVGDPDALIPKYVADLRIPTVDAQNGYAVLSRWGDGRGWPFKCLSCGSTVVYSSKGRSHKIDYGIELTSRPWRRYPNGSTTERVLPLRPIWPGLLVNLIVYSLIVYMLVFAFFDFRRLRRRRRGQCLKCGHQLLAEQVACPECAWHRT